MITFAALVLALSLVTLLLLGLPTARRLVRSGPLRASDPDADRLRTEWSAIAAHRP